jgi:hypothetical protein
MFIDYFLSTFSKVERKEDKMGGLEQLEGVMWRLLLKKNGAT